MDEMVKATNTCTLADIQKYLASLDVTLSLQAISTYSRKLLASLEDIRVTNERMNAMVREAAKYPELDFSEVINRVAGQKILDAILSKPDEEWNDIALDKLLREMNAQTKAVAYARRLDIQAFAGKKPCGRGRCDRGHAAQADGPHRRRGGAADALGRREDRAAGGKRKPARCICRRGRGHTRGCMSPPASGRTERTA